MIGCIRRRIGFAIVAGLALTPAAAAQTAAGATSTIGSWLVTCVDASLATARCEMTQRVVTDDGAIQILAASVVATRDAQPARLTFTTPLGVWLEPGALLVSPTGFTRELAYERCAPDGCVLHAELDEALRSAFAAGGLAELRFADRLKQPLAAPVSLDGFANAVAKLEEETAEPQGFGAWLRGIFG